MSPHQWTSVTPSPWRIFFLALGIVVIAAQLYAMVVVTRQQVERAQARDSLESRASRATVNCIRNFGSASLARACISTITVASAP